MNRYEKINNKEYIYKNIRLFYECSSEKTFNNVFKDITQSILEYTFYNIDEKDLKNLIFNFKRLKLKKQPYQEIYKNIQKIINKNINKVLDNSFNIVDNLTENITY